MSADVVRRMYDAISAGDLESFTALLDPRIVWTVPGSHNLAGTFTGVPALLAHLAEVAQRTGSPFGVCAIQGHVRPWLCTNTAPGT